MHRTKKEDDFMPSSASLNGGGGYGRMEPDGQQFEVDHLATFTVGGRQGLLTPEDGIRKLKMMDSTTGIWTMRCILIIGRRAVSVIEKQSGDQIEQFPIHLVQEPTAIFNNDRKDVYNNLVLFTVIEDSKSASSTPTEMHIFQCVSAPAQDVVEEIKGARDTTPRRLHRADPIPPAPVNPAPKPPNDYQGGGNVREAVRNINGFSERGPEINQSYIASGDNLSTISERTNRDVVSKETKTDEQILNHCFDDIEKFVGRLQLAASAYKELLGRRQKRGKTKKDKAIGDVEEDAPDGMLSMRARPPPFEDFVDIFKKFKLAMNLLAKLQPYIHDPNAPELVHFLFTPLSLVVDASKDPKHGMVDLPNRVVSPLLTGDARELLVHCLTTKESQLWLSLGDAWTASKEQWKTFVPPYYPRFSDGWEPYTPSVKEEKGLHTEQISQALHHQKSIAQERKSAYNQVAQFPRTDDRPLNGTNFNENRQRQLQMEREKEEELERERERERYRQEPVIRPSPKREEERYRPEPVRQPSPPPPEQIRSPPPAPVSNFNKPNQQIHDEKLSWDEKQKRFYSELRNRNARIYEVIHERTGKNQKELTLAKGEILELLNDDRNWWKLRNSRGEIGHAPYTILKAYQAEMTPDYLANNEKYDGYNDRYDRDSGKGYSPPQVPKPPPAPPVPSLQPTPMNKLRDVNQNKNKKEESNMDNVHDELKKRMSTGKSLGKNLLKHQKSTTAVYINQYSNWNECEDWLLSKGFSDRTIEALSGMSGSELFALSKRDIYRNISREEAARLESQLIVQKNICGYGSLGQSELKAILRRQKERTDSPRSPYDDYILGAPPDFNPENPSNNSLSFISDGR